MLLRIALAACAVACASRAQTLAPEVVEIAAGAVAKITASAIFLADRSVESVLDGEFSTDGPFGALLQPLLSIEVDRERSQVTATVAGVSRTAVYRPGIGCALVLDGELPVGSDRTGGPDVDATRVRWPLGDLDAAGELGEGGDPEALRRAVDAAFTGYAPPADPRTRAVIVVHRGRIVAERYADGFDQTTRLHGWSMAKSMVDALVGVRVGQGRVATSGPTGYSQWTDERAQITLEDMLRMTSGLAWEERYDKLDSDVPRMLFARRDAAGFGADRVLENAPGLVWAYSSGTTNAICAVLRESFDSLDDYLAFPRTHLFGRIGMHSAVIECDPNGMLVGSSYAYATARDWARFGMLYLGDGVFAGERILPEGWVATSTTPTKRASRGRYGRHWWLNAGETLAGDRRVYPDLPSDMFYASGYEDQVVAVFPSHDAVVVRLGCTKARRSFRIGEFLKSVVAALPPARGYSIPVVDLAYETHRQIVVDREAGQYLGHPTTILAEDRESILCVYPKGHGRGAIVYKRSSDGGRTWSERLPVPDNWSTSKEVPTIHRMVAPDGTKRLVVFSGLFPIRRALSEDDGATWGPLEPIGEFGGIVAMGDVVALRDGRSMALFHDDGRFIRAGSKQRNPVAFHVYKTISADGGLTWSEPEVVTTHPRAHLCEPGAVRSPDGKRIALLLRENSRKLNSFVVFSDDEGSTWSKPQMLPGSLTGDRHTARSLPDGRVFISFRDTTLASDTQGDWVAWVGEWDHIENCTEGGYRVRLMDNKHRWDCAYPGVVVLDDGTVVTTTYGHWSMGEKPYVVTLRLDVAELDRRARAVR